VVVVRGIERRRYTRLLNRKRQRLPPFRGHPPHSLCLLPHHMPLPHGTCKSMKNGITKSNVACLLYRVMLLDCIACTTGTCRSFFFFVSFFVSFFGSFFPFSTNGRLKPARRLFGRQYGPDEEEIPNRPLVVRVNECANLHWRGGAGRERGAWSGRPEGS